MTDFHALDRQRHRRAELIDRVQKRMAKAQPATGYPALGFTLMPRELRAAAEAAVDALAGDLK